MHTKSDDYLKKCNKIGKLEKIKTTLEKLITNINEYVVDRFVSFYLFYSRSLKPLLYS
jgi:hypothetical protein